MTGDHLTEEGTSKTVVVNDVLLHYHEAGTGYPVIFLHSFGPGTTAWVTFYKNLPALAQHFRCILLDMPNFAKSGPVIYEEPVHSFFAKTVQGFMDCLGIERAHLIGNSQGGQVALVFAYMFPQRVNKLVWGAGHIGTGGDRYLMGNIPSEGVRAELDETGYPDWETVRKYLLVHIDDPALVTDELVGYIHYHATNRPDLVEARTRSISVEYDHGPEIVHIKAPTLMIWGRYDRMCVFEIGINALNHIPDSRFVLFNNCGHWPPYEKPEEYNAFVIDFLRGDWS